MQRYKIYKEKHNILYLSQITLLIKTKIKIKFNKKPHIVLQNVSKRKIYKKTKNKINMHDKDNVQKTIREMFESSDKFNSNEYNIHDSNRDTYIHFKKNSQTIQIKEFDKTNNPLILLEYNKKTQKLNIKVKKNLNKEGILENQINQIYGSLIKENEKNYFSSEQKKHLSKKSKKSVLIPKVILTGLLATSIISPTLAYFHHSNQRELITEQLINEQNEISKNIQDEISNYMNKINEYENYIQNLNLAILEPKINFNDYPEIESKFENLDSLIQNINETSLNESLQEKYEYYIPLLINKTNQTYQNLFIFWDIIQEQINENENLNFQEAPYFLSSIIQKETNWFNFSVGYSGETGIGQQMPYIVEKNYHLDTDYQKILEQNLKQKLRTVNTWGTRTGFRVLLNTIQEIENNNSIEINYEILQEMDPRFNFEHQFDILTNEISEKIDYFQNSNKINLQTIAASYNGGNYGYQNYYPQQYATEVLGYMQLLLEFENTFQEIIDTTTSQQRQDILNNYIEQNENFINQSIQQKRHQSRPELLENILNEHKNNIEDHIQIYNRNQENNIIFYENLEQNIKENNSQIAVILNNL